MAFRNLMDSVKNFFGPNNAFFNGPRAEEDTQYTPANESQPYPPMQQGAVQPNAAGYEQQPLQPQLPQMQQGAYQQPRQPFAQAAYQQPAYQAQPFQQPQVAQQQQPQMQQPQQMQQPAYSASPLQQGYQPPQQRNRRAAQHPQQAEAENVVPFPGAAAQPVQQQPAAPAQPAPKQSVSCVVINARSIADCRSAIDVLRSGDCAIAVMDNIADQAEVRRYVDTLNGACFSLGCSMTRLSSRVGVYLLAPTSMQVYIDHTTTQMNSHSRPPQQGGMQQRAFNGMFTQPQAQPTYGQAAYQQQPNPFAPPQPAYQQPAFSEQQPSQGYVPDHEAGEYSSAVM